MAEDARGKGEEAAERFEAYLASYPDDPRAWFRLGWTNMARLDRNARGAEAFQHALAIWPDDSSSRINLATCYLKLRRYRDAVEEYDRAFAIAPDQLWGPYVNHEFGFTLVRLGELDRAGDVFEKKLALDDPVKKAEAHRSLALLEMYRGRYATAKAHLEEAVLITAAEKSAIKELRNRGYLCLVGQRLRQRPRVVEQLRQMVRLVERNSFSPDMLVLVGRLQAREHRTADATRTLDGMRLAAKNNFASSMVTRTGRADEAAIAVLEGEIALARGQAPEAVSHLETALRLESTFRLSRAPLAAAYEAAGEHDKAAAHYEQLIADEPLGLEAQEDFQQAHLELARIYERLGQPGKARAIAQRLLDRWKDADTGLPLLDDTRALIKGLDGAP